MIAKLELLPYSLGTLLWFVPMALWASGRSQLEDWPIYKVKCPTSDDQQKPKYQILHWNHLLLVTNEDAADILGQAQAEAIPTVSNATPEAFSAGVGLLERPQPSLVTRQGGELTSWVC